LPFSGGVRICCARAGHSTKRFDELIQGNVDWGASGNGFFDIEEWEKDPPPDR
jgi:hypothetical protein